MLKRTLPAILVVVFAAAVVCAQQQPPTPSPTPQPQATPTPTPLPKPTTPPQDGPPAPRPKTEQTPEQRAAAAEAKRKYEALLDKAKRGEGAVDFKALRFAYFETPDYSPLAGMAAYRSLWNAPSYEEAVKLADAVLAKTYVDINAHMVAYVAHSALKNEAKARHHKTWADGLLASLRSGGDGKSVGTAFDVISVSEEYAFLRSLDLRPIGQSLVRENGHVYDALVAVDMKTNQRVTYYFNVDRPFNALGRD